MFSPTLPGFQLTFLHPPVRATVGEVRYSIEIDVGGGNFRGERVNFTKPDFEENFS